MIIQKLEKALAAALDTAGVELPEGFQVNVESSADLRFGDYQSNAAMILAKVARTNPRELAAKVIEALELEELAEADIAGPGFINFRIKKEAWSLRVSDLMNDARLGVPLAQLAQTIVVDFSAPNVAKPMHVGHIRSTIIGDSLSRIARFLGHKVITDNHIGDWGTQFGMIIHGWKTVLNEADLQTDPVTELLRVYRTVNSLCGEDESIRDICKQELVKLQGGDAENLVIWEKCVELSKQGLQGIYDRLDVDFDYWYGESFYNDRLAPLVDDMLESGVARISEGAVCVFFDGDKKLEDKPTVVRKADGGFLYATTDLATIDFRVEEWAADQIWYVVGAPQQLHFQQIFEATRKRGLAPSMHHVSFGSILGEDRKLMKTRSGDNVQLVDVLDEAVERSLKSAALWDEAKDRLKDSALGLSGGQQQRLCIARTIAVRPKVILMDEPCSALDPIATAKVEELMLELRKDFTIVIVTHSMQQASRISDNTAFFYLGELIEYGSTTQIFTNPSVKQTEDYISGRFG